MQGYESVSETAQVGDRGHSHEVRERPEHRRPAAARLTEATDLLASLRDRLKDEFNWDEKRELVELLVAGVVVDTVGEGSNKRSEIQVTYAFDGSEATRRDIRGELNYNVSRTIEFASSRGSRA